MIHTRLLAVATLLVALVLPLESCSFLRSATDRDVDVSRIEVTLVQVADRTTAYLLTDELIDDEARDVGLSMAADAMAIVAVGGSVGIDQLETVVEPLLVVHDAYVTADPELDDDELAKRVYLRSSEILQAIIDEARVGEAGD